MAIQYLCDTNVISELMRPTPQPAVEKWLLDQGKVYLSVISIEEIRYGLERKNLAKKRIWFEQFMPEYTEILELNGHIADHSGRLRAKFQRSGETRSQPDMLIAATAWAHGLTLATRNTKDFKGTGIQVYNPFSHK
jgi:Predicted nucleic acid-binding protein, contains PIN domain